MQIDDETDPVNPLLLFPQRDLEVDPDIQRRNIENLQILGSKTPQTQTKTPLPSKSKLKTLAKVLDAETDPNHKERCPVNRKIDEMHKMKIQSFPVDSESSVKDSFTLERNSKIKQFKTTLSDATKRQSDNSLDFHA